MPFFFLLLGLSSPISESRSGNSFCVFTNLSFGMNSLAFVLADQSDFSTLKLPVLNVAGVLCCYWKPPNWFC